MALVGCAARTYHPTSRRIARENGTIVDVDAIDVVVDHRGDGELDASAHITADTTVRAIRLAGAHDPPCGGGVLARSVMVDQHPRSPISIPVEGDARVDVSFVPKDLPARLRERAWIDVDSDDGCVRVDLVRADGTYEWVEAPRWAFGASLDAVKASGGDLGWGALASLSGARVVGRFQLGANLRAGRTSGGDQGHLDLLGGAPTVGVRLVDAARWPVSIALAYDVLVPASSEGFRALVHGPRLSLRLGYGGEPVPWHAFHTRHGASFLGVTLDAAHWNDGGWITGVGLAFAVGR